MELQPALAAGARASKPPFRSLNGGWTFEAAEEVCSDNTLCAPSNILELLMQLVDKSLVTVEIESGRYQFLETLRQFAHGTLRKAANSKPCASSTMSKIHRRLPDSGFAASFTGRQSGVLVERDGREHDNSRAALTYISA